VESELQHFHYHRPENFTKRPLSRRQVLKPVRTSAESAPNNQSTSLTNWNCGDPTCFRLSIPNQTAIVNTRESYHSQSLHPVFSSHLSPAIFLGIKSFESSFFFGIKSFESSISSRVGFLARHRHVIAKSSIFESSRILARHRHVIPTSSLPGPFESRFFFRQSLPSQVSVPDSETAAHHFSPVPTSVLRRWFFSGHIFFRLESNKFFSWSSPRGPALDTTLLAKGHTTDLALPKLCLTLFPSDHKSFGPSS